MKTGSGTVPKDFLYRYMIGTLAKAHGQSKRHIEKKYTVKDYYELVVENSINEPKDK